MTPPVRDVTEALRLFEVACEVTADAATILRHAPAYEEVAHTAMRIEADLGVLLVLLRKAASAADAGVLR